MANETDKPERKKSKYHQGKFKTRNPQKYMGDPSNIQYRSGWELGYMMKLDHDPKVLKWASEEMHVSYYNPIDKKKHRYFPDFIVQKQTESGIQTFMIEIKPHAQTKPPKKSKNRKKMLNETTTYITNQAKWAAAEEYCKRHGMIFQILSEKELKI